MIYYFCFDLLISFMVQKRISKFNYRGSSYFPYLLIVIHEPSVGWTKTNERLFCHEAFGSFKTKLRFMIFQVGIYDFSGKESNVRTVSLMHTVAS